MIRLKRSCFFLFSLTAIFCGCQRDPVIISESGYPDDIGKIILTKCAVSGCHNEESKDAAAGLSLTTWENMFKGTRNGAAVIPYRHDFSPLFMFVNTHHDLGPAAMPTMPLNAPPLSREEVIKIKEWINSGAPDRSGHVKFSDDPDRKKIYVTNQGCDVVTVIDAATGLIMRYVDVGISGNIESPHMIKVAPDGKHWYVIFTAGTVIRKFRAADDMPVGEAKLGTGSWNTFAITSDSKKAFIADWVADGRIAYVDLENMRLEKYYQGSQLFVFPHGTAISPDDKTLYVTAQTGNFIYKVNIANPDLPEVEEIVLEPGAAKTTASSLDPHEILMSPDGAKYFVTCQKSNEVRVFNTGNDSLVAVIKTGEYPQEMSFSNTRNYLFVTCTEDDETFPGHTGSVSVIDCANLVEIKRLNAGYQPHGIAVDDEAGKVYVANRNNNMEGPAPHHTTSCGGRSGYLTAINLNTLELVPGYRPEVAVDPYSVAVRR